MNYNKYANKAKNKINQYGGECYIIRKGADEVYNEDTCEYESTSIKIDGKGVLSNYDEIQVDGSSVLSGDLKLMCILDKAPELTDRITFGKKTYSIVKINEINPDGRCVIYYDLQVR